MERVLGCFVAVYGFVERFVTDKKKADIHLEKSFKVHCAIRFRLNTRKKAELHVSRPLNACFAAILLLSSDKFALPPGKKSSSSTAFIKHRINTHESAQQLAKNLLAKSHNSKSYQKLEIDQLWNIQTSRHHYFNTQNRAQFKPASTLVTHL